MTDIVVVDGVQFQDSEVDNLGNAGSGIANFTETIDVSASHYHIEIASSMNLTSQAKGGGKVSVSSTMDFTDTDTEVRINQPSSDAGLSETITATKRSVISIIDSLDFSATPSTPITAVVVDAMDFSATPTLSRSMPTLVSAMDLSASQVGLRHSTASVVSTMNTNDTDGQAARTVSASDSADLTGTVDTTRTVIGTESESADLTETVGAVGSILEELASTFNATEAITLHLHATTSVADAMEFDERIRTSNDVINDFWVNGKAAGALWSGLPFNSMVELDGEVYGAGPDGLYVMAQTANDAGAIINAEVAWDLSTFGSLQRKRFGGIYVCGMCHIPFTIKIANPDGTFTYKTRTTSGKGKAQQHRAEPGRGLAAVHNRVSLLQTKNFAVDHVMVEFEQIARRV